MLQPLATLKVTKEFKLDKIQSQNFLDKYYKMRQRAVKILGLLGVADYRTLQKREIWNEH